MEPKQLYADFMVAIDAMTDLYGRYDILKAMKEYVDAKIPSTKEEIANAEAPSNISQLTNYLVVDAVGTVYKVDTKTGELTKV